MHAKNAHARRTTITKHDLSKCHVHIAKKHLNEWQSPNNDTTMSFDVELDWARLDLDQAGPDSTQVTFFFTDCSIFVFSQHIVQIVCFSPHIVHIVSHIVLRGGAEGIFA